MNIVPNNARPVRWPAEWEPHQRTWIAWPHRHEDWPGKFEPIPWVYTEIVRQLTLSEEVGILVHNEKVATAASMMLQQVGIDLSRIIFQQIATDRVWMRDTGPIFIHGADGNSLVLDWRFNGWAKYDNHFDDDAVPERLAASFGWNRIQPRCHDHRVVLEGGSIDGNGAGTLLTTEECLLSEIQHRNPHMNRADYEQIFRDYLGIRKVLWLGRGIVGDDTHGHIDDLARFVNPRTVVTVVETNENDVNYIPLRENLDRLRTMSNADGENLEIITLPMPQPVMFAGERLPASYANFYIANDRVLVPTFNDPRDRHALGTIADLFPSREIIGIHAVDLVWGLGTLHCLTQQQPATTSNQKIS